MSKHLRVIFLSSMLLFVLVLSLGRPLAASAQDETPPPAATEEAVDPPPAEAPIMLESVATEPPIVTEDFAATELPVEEADSISPLVESEVDEMGDESAATEDITVSEILEAAPDSTEIVVLSENGQALPLASTAAAEIVAAVDPVWCPNGQNPGNDMDDGVQNCSNAFATPQALIDNMDAVDPRLGGRQLYEQPGTIYFTADPGGSFILIPGGLDDADAALYEADYNALKRYSLTLQGGWNGATGAGYELTGGQTQFINNGVQIGTSANPWVGNITIKNITISSDPLSTADAGLTVFTDGRLFLDYVEVLGNPNGGGASLDNDSGSQDVIIRHSNFNGNADTGLEVVSNGLIRLVDVNANDNLGEGASLTTSNGEVNITGGSTFDNNSNHGLSVEAYGNITLLNVIARDNGGDGIHLENTSGVGAISITTGRFYRNGGDGLEAYSLADITLFNVFSNRNTTFGAYLDNSTGSGNIDVSSSIFSYNGSDGLDALSLRNITLTDVTANDNDGDGAYLDNSSGSGGISVSSSVFGDGTDVGTAGNGENGLVAYSDGNVEVTNSQFYGSDDENGLLVVSDGGSIMLDGVIAYQNDEDGARLEASGSAGNVIVKNSQFYENKDGGLDAFSASGFIDLEGVTAHDNTYDGAWLTTLFSGDATIICGQFKNNGGFGVDGLNVDGTFTLDDVTFSNNGGGDYDGSPVTTSGGCKVVVDPGNPIPPGGGTDISGANGQGPKYTLPLQIVPASDGEQVGLDCSSYSGTKLVLPDGGRVILPCPILDLGQLSGKPQDQLPGPLGGQFGFISALEVEVTHNGQPVQTLETEMIIDFLIPDGLQGANLAILRWDAVQAQWVEVPGGIKTGDGRFMVASNFTGLYVLVTK